MNAHKFLLVFLLFLYGTIFNSSAQTFAWSSRYSSPDADSSIDVRIDVSGSIHFAGVTKTPGANKVVTRYISNAGVVQWTRIANTTLPGKIEFLKRDAGFNTVVICSTSTGFVMLKYNINCTEDWRINLAGTPLGFTTNAGNIYAGFQGSHGFIATCYQISNGSIIWTKSDVNGDNANGFAVDRNNNIYIGGQNINGGGNQDMRITKFNSASTPYVWSTVYSVGSGYDNVNGLNVDDNGYVYVTGAIDAYSSSDFLYLSRFSPSGSFLWSTILGTMGGFNDVFDAKFIAIDNQNNPIVLGSVYVTTQSATPFNIYFAKKFDRASGTQLWVQTPNYTGTPIHEVLYNYTMDQFNNVYMCGKLDISASNNSARCAITKIETATGTKKWNWYGTNSSTSDVSNCVRVNSTGDVYAGNTERYVNVDMVLRKFTQPNNGQRLIEENTFANNVVVYPNPFSENFNVTLSTNGTLTSIELYDISGKIVFETKTSLESFQFDENIPAGIYTLVISNEEIRNCYKIVRE